MFDNTDSIKNIAADLMHRNDWVILDTETTGLDEYAEAVSIGIIDPAGNVLVDALVQPTQMIPAKATAIHGISNEMVKNARSFRDTIPMIHAATAEKTIVVYNAPYDKRILTQSFDPYICDHRFGDNELEMMINIDRSEWLDVMAPYAEYHGDYNDYYDSYRWQKLTMAAAQMDVTVSGDAHRAIPDCLMTLGVIKAVYERELMENLNK